MIHESTLRSANRLLREGRLDDAIGLLRPAVSDDPRLGGHLATILLHFVDTEPARSEALALLHAAHAAGDSEAAYRLAFLSLGGRAVPRDDERIAAWLAEAVSAGHLLAMRAAALGLSSSNLAASNQFLERAAAAGDPVSAFLLWARLAEGRGPGIDPRLQQMLAAMVQRAGLDTIALDPATDSSPANGEATYDVAALTAAVSLHTLCEGPRVARADQVLDLDECRFVMAMAHPLLRPSKVYDVSRDGDRTHPVRTSADASFDVMYEDIALRILQSRLCATAGLPLGNAEPLVVLRYRPGEQYRPHRDYLSPQALAQSSPSAGQRQATVCCYLSSVAAGGQTAFPERAVQVEPAAGRVVVFDNLDERGRPDPKSLHAGVAVESGEKWLATLWIRQAGLRSQ